MDRQELRKLIQGPLCTLPTPFDDDFRIDHGRMRELVRWLISEGLGAANTVLKVAVIGGEGPTLTDDEWPALLRTVIQAADGKAHVRPEHAGSIDAQQVRELVEELLEGGKDAFERRRLKYGF